MKQTCIIFLRLLQRDFYVQRTYFKDYFINYGIIYPFICIFVFGFLQSHLYFANVTPQKLTTLLSGNILLIFLVMTFKHHLELFFDLQSDRYIDYQITLLDPRLVLVERVISAAIFGFLVALPFYPSAKLILQGNMDTSATSWPSLLLILALSALVCSSFNVFIACFLTKTSQLSHLWPRCNEPLLMLGGFWVPWFVVWQFSPMLGKLALLNPLLYVTDGVRQAILGGDQFLSIRVASTGLLVFSLIFVALACCFFKRRVDHI